MIYASPVTGDWDLHLRTLHNMLPYFHAAGHLPYAKNLHMFLQDMYTLANHMTPEDYENFTKNGYFTVRRSDKFWGGLWSDLTIEQTLMRMIKSRGGLIGTLSYK